MSPPIFCQNPQIRQATGARNHWQRTVTCPNRCLSHEHKLHHKDASSHAIIARHSCAFAHFGEFLEIN